MNLYNNPLGLVLKDRMNTHYGILIERLVKLAHFIDDLLKKGDKAP